MTSRISVMGAPTCVRILATAAPIVPSGRGGHVQLGARSQTIKLGDGNDQAVLASDTVTVCVRRALEKQNRDRGDAVQMRDTTDRFNVGVKAIASEKATLN
jgi:hypothetical protein